MWRIDTRLTRSPEAEPPWRLVLLLVAAGLLNACAWQRPMAPFPPVVVPETPAREVERHRFLLGKGDTVVGQLAAVRVRPGDTLPDIARHFGLGHEEIGAANPDLDMWAPEAESRVLLPLQFVLPDAPRKGIVINLAAMRLFSFPDGQAGRVISYPVGIGKEGRSTPTGEMFVARKSVKPTWYVPESIRRDHEKRGDPLPAVVSPGPDNPLGDYALYLSRPSYLIHGTNKPYAIGLRASNGCLRLYPENIKTLYQATPIKTPVHVVNQPYLLGWLKGQPYLEAHAPQEELNAQALKKALYAKLRAIERRHGWTLDWPKIETVLAEARGIPVPILARTPSIDQVVAQAVELDPPAELYGRPPPPPPVGQGDWTITVLETEDELTARRAAAVLNHMGPQIPARAVPLADGRYRVIAGPFKDAKATKAVAKRMALDLELHGKIQPPRQELTVAQ
ncbi:L,D-transpeptidase family protein [Candidatus Methylocalor cossyra]|uniref:L,D-transpeptidase ErfK/SrfK n=1 Tax=Candidatus Methylocalor cossyra TaxID=3108543 RepID=A0ABP1CAZ5_9GAMM